MAIKSFIANMAANMIAPRIYADQKDAIGIQHKLLKKFVHHAANTDFGKEHGFSSVKNYLDFKAAVPLRDYEQLKNYIERIASGKHDVLWPGQPAYFCTSSGTTSGTKYIPLTKEQLKEIT